MVPFFFSAWVKAAREIRKSVVAKTIFFMCLGFVPVRLKESGRRVDGFEIFISITES